MKSTILLLHHNTTMEVIRPDEMRKALKWVLNDRQKKGRGELFFCYHRMAKDFMWGNKEEATEQMKIWRRQKKEGILHMNPKNNVTKLINGTTWYILVVQQGSSPATIQPIGVDRLGLGFDDIYLVDGFIYCFKQQANRDAIYNYVMKP